MNRAIVLLAAGATCVGCSAAGGNSSAGGGSCASGINIDGVAMLGAVLSKAKRPPAAGEFKATSPACGGDRRSKVPVVRLRGVDPHLGVGMPGRPKHYYLPTGRLLSLRSHPLHRAVFAHKAIWPPGRHCENKSLRGVVLYSPISEPQFIVTVGGKRTVVQVKRNTKVTGRKSYGQPELRLKDRVQIIGEACSPDHIRARTIRILTG